jgi:hypothetical protein
MIMFPPWSKRERARDRAAALDRIRSEVTSWPGVSMAPHQFDAVEFQLDGTEFGHLHRDGRMDVPFVRRIRNALVEGRDADVHPWVPDSGWVTFSVASGHDVDHALYLLHLSYLYRTIVSVRDGAVATLETARGEVEALQLTGRLSDAFEDLLARRGVAAGVEA